MAAVHLILIILAIVCFFFAAVGIITPRGTNLVAAGLLLWLFATLIGR